jgi:hypothetical protein
LFHDKTPENVTEMNMMLSRRCRGGPSAGSDKWLEIKHDINNWLKGNFKTSLTRTEDLAIN